MAKSTAINVKSIWKTKPEPAKGKSGNQDRLVLHVTEAHVFYASRGGNVMNEFDSAQRCQIARFLKVASHDRTATAAEWAQAQKTLAPWIKARGI
jgi:hypothetical protein